MAAVIDQFDVSGRSALVTGAASGIGLAYAEALAEAGARVTIADIDADAAAKQAKLFGDRGWTTMPVRMDVADTLSVEAGFDAHVAAWGGVDIVFANAGLGSGGGFMHPAGGRDPDGQIDTNDPVHWERTIAVNLNGAHNTIRAAAARMKAAGTRGSIVVTTSNASTIVVPIVGTAYMAAKAGVAHLVRTVALELAGSGIRVNAIAPGSFITNIGGGVLHDPAVQAVWAEKIPLGAMGRTEQMKPLALYLASDASSFMTGSELIIDGGVSLAGH